MSQFIENPFEDLWKDFDPEKFKKDICTLIDKLIATKDQDKIQGTVEEIDDMVMSLVIVLKLKGVEAIEVVKLEDLPGELIDQLGFDEVDLIDGFIPKNLIPEEFQDKLKDKPQKKKNKWLRNED